MVRTSLILFSTKFWKVAQNMLKFCSRVPKKSPKAHNNRQFHPKKLKESGNNGCKTNCAVQKAREISSAICTARHFQFWIVEFEAQTRVSFLSPSLSRRIWAWVLGPPCFVCLPLNGGTLLVINRQQVCYSMRCNWQWLIDVLLCYCFDGLFELIAYWHFIFKLMYMAYWRFIINGRL